jgi:hypothetical protein
MNHLNGYKHDETVPHFYELCRHYQNKKKAVGLERDPLSLVSTIEELFDKKSSGSCLETENTADKRRSLGRYSSLADSDHGVCLFVLLAVETKWYHYSRYG